MRGPLLRDRCAREVDDGEGAIDAGLPFADALGVPNDGAGAFGRLAVSAEDGDAIAELGEGLGQVRPDESPASGYHDISHLLQLSSTNTTTAMVRARSPHNDPRIQGSERTVQEGSAPGQAMKFHALHPKSVV